MSKPYQLTRLLSTALEDTYRYELSSSANSETPLQELVLPFLRQELTKLTDRILMRLHDRSTFALNQTVYQLDGVPLTEREGISFLEYALEGMEAYHAKLGRFVFPDQYSLLGTPFASPSVLRSPKGPFLPRVEIHLKDMLLDFYQEDVLPRICTKKGEEPDSYGETAYVDADLLELLHARIGKGRLVAAIKVVGDPSIWDIAKDRCKLIDALKDPPREERVIADAVATGEGRYQLDPDAVRYVFRWIIDQTLDLEVEYLQRLLIDQG